MNKIILSACVAAMLSTTAFAAPFSDDWLIELMTGDPVELSDEEPEIDEELVEPDPIEWTEDGPEWESSDEWVCGPWWVCEDDLNRDGEHDNPPPKEPEPTGYAVLYIDQPSGGQLRSPRSRLSAGRRSTVGRRGRR